jgi:hypothetical protein
MITVEAKPDFGGDSSREGRRRGPTVQRESAIAGEATPWKSHYPSGIG